MRVGSHKPVRPELVEGPPFFHGEAMPKHLLLVSHPTTPASIPTPGVRFERKGAILRMTFGIPDDTSSIAFANRVGPLAKQSAERRQNELWKHTCFEAFVRPAGRSEYVEFNFSPSLEWAAYQFDDYRMGMRNADVPIPAVIPTLHSNRFELSARIELPDWGADQWLINFAAVIEEKSGRQSYWALRHPSEGPPDFHHPDCFALTLPAPGGA